MCTESHHKQLGKSYPKHTRNMCRNSVETFQQVMTFNAVSWLRGLHGSFRSLCRGHACTHSIARGQACCGLSWLIPVYSNDWIWNLMNRLRDSSVAQQQCILQIYRRSLLLQLIAFSKRYLESLTNRRFFGSLCWLCSTCSHHLQIELHFLSPHSELVCMYTYYVHVYSITAL